MPSKVWVVGEEVLASDFNPYMQEQVIATFANAAARNAGITAPKVGQFSWLSDLLQLQVWTGAAWVSYHAATLLGYAERTTNSAQTPNVLADSGLTITATLPTGRRGRLTFEALAQAGQNTNQLFIARLQADATILQQRQWNLSLSVTAYGVSATAFHVGDGASHVYKVYYQSGAAATNVLIMAGSTTPATLTLEDLG